jgi:hypothetical protein
VIVRQAARSPATRVAGDNCVPPHFSMPSVRESSIGWRLMRRRVGGLRVRNNSEYLCASSHTCCFVELSRSLCQTRNLTDDQTRRCLTPSVYMWRKGDGLAILPVWFRVLLLPRYRTSRWAEVLHGRVGGNQISTLTFALCSSTPPHCTPRSSMTVLRVAQSHRPHTPTCAHGPDQPPQAAAQDTSAWEATPEAPLRL